MGRICSGSYFEQLLACPFLHSRATLLLLSTVSILAVVRSSTGAPTDQLNSHELDQLYRQQELTRLKQRILEGLGIKKIPDVSKMNVSREEYERMHRVYLHSVQLQRLREQEAASRQTKGPANNALLPHQSFYTFPHSPSAAPLAVKRTLQQAGESWFYFPMDIREYRPEVSSAMVRLLLIWPTVHEHAIRLRAYQLVRNTGDASAGLERLLVDQKELRSDVAGNRWVELDVRRAAEAWLQDPASNLGLELHCRGCAAAGVSLDTEEHPTENVLDATLNVLTVSHTRTRGRRSVDLGAPQLRRTNCSSNGDRCCRHSMEVIFKELEDFDFILQPTKYDAGFCKGRCPPRYNPASHHALLQSLVWKHDRSMAPRPCCAPSKLKSLQMLVLDADDPTKLRVVSWTEMEVEECACT